MERRTASNEASYQIDWASQCFELAEVILVRLDLDGHVLAINKKGEEVLGLPRTQIVGEDWFANFVPAHARADVREVFRELNSCAAGNADYHENPVRTGDGSERLIAWHNTVLRDEGGRVVGCLSSGEDVTEHRRAVTALQESEARFRATFEQAAVGMAHVGLGGRFLRFNDKLSAITGYDRSELERLTFQDITHPADLQADLNLAQALHAGDIPHYSMEKRYIRKDGSVVWINLTGSLVRDADGEPDYFIAVVEDINKRKQAETLRKDEELQRMALAAAGAGAWEWDVKNGLQIWSSEIYNFFDLEPADGPLNLNEWISRCIHPDDREAFEQVVSKAMAEGGDFRVVYRALGSGGADRWIETIGQVLLDAKRQARRAFGLSHDITQQRRFEQTLRHSEERLRLAMSAGGLGVWEWDVGSGRVEWSANLEAYGGIVAGGFGGTLDAFRSLVHPDDRDRVEKALEEALAGREEYDIEFRMVRPSGGIRWAATQALVLRDREGNPLRMIGVDKDISARKEWEERQDRLASELDHRVKNILAVVQAIASRTLRTSADLGTFLARLHALSAAHKLLTASRWESVDMAELAAQALAAYPAERVYIHGSSFALTPKAAQTLALVLHELGTNAAKYGALSGDTGTVSFSWKFVRQTGDREAALLMDWVECGGPPVAGPITRGFGTQVIERSVSTDFGGTVDLQFGAEGMRAHFHMPADSLGRDVSSASAPAVQSTGLDPLEIR